MKIVFWVWDVLTSNTKLPEEQEAKEKLRVVSQNIPFFELLYQSPVLGSHFFV